MYYFVFRSIKTSQSGFISGPSSAGKQSSSSSGRSFSPAGSRPKTSPTALNTSPHRNEHSPAAKSPLLGTAPPGLLPPPDKGRFKVNQYQDFCNFFCMVQTRVLYMYEKFFSFVGVWGMEKMSFLYFLYDVHTHVILAFPSSQNWGGVCTRLYTRSHILGEMA